MTAIIVTDADFLNDANLAAMNPCKGPGRMGTLGKWVHGSHRPAARQKSRSSREEWNERKKAV